MPKTAKNSLRTHEKDSLRDAFNTAYCIARNCSSMRENDQAREMLARTGDTINKLYKELLPPSAERNVKSMLVEDICRHLTGSSYTEFLDVRNTILGRTGNHGKQIPALWATAAVTFLINPL